MNSRKKTRVAIFNTHPIQYYAPIWRKLSQYDDLDVKVFYGSDLSIRGYQDHEFKTEVSWDTPILEGYKSIFLGGSRMIKRISFFNPMPWSAIKTIFLEKPDIVLITAYNSAFWYGIILAVRASGSSLLMRHEGSDQAFRRGLIKNIFRNIFLKYCYRLTKHFAVVGIPARRHFQKFGVKESRMTFSPFCIDTEWFENEKDKWMKCRSELRQSLGMNDDHIAVVFSGKLVEKKDPLLLLEAIKKIPESLRSTIHLVIAGSGPLLNELVSVAKPLLRHRFHPLGFLNQSKIGQAYAIGDIFVLPSRFEETWGLVVNEALQFGLPVIVPLPLVREKISFLIMKPAGFLRQATPVNYLEPFNP